MTKPKPPTVHNHEWRANPYNPDPDPNDRCKVCGMPRYEVMGPFARRKARLAAYEGIGSKLD